MRDISSYKGNVEYVNKEFDCIGTEIIISGGKMSSGPVAPFGRIFLRVFAAHLP